MLFYFAEQQVLIAGGKLESDFDAYEGAYRIVLEQLALITRLVNIL